MAARLVAIVTPLLLSLSACGPGADPPASQRAGTHLQRLYADGTVYAGSGDFVREPWACVRDHDTGLVWEVKSATDSLHGKDHTYTWHNTDELAHKGDAGVIDGGTCAGARCDTAGLVEAVNAEGLCGFGDWRLPDQKEIATLNDPDAAAPGPTVSAEHFPTLLAEQYWTRDSHLYYPGAWTWNFRYGHNQVDWKRTPKRALLVRGQAQVALARPED